MTFGTPETTATPLDTSALIDALRRGNLATAASLIDSTQSDPRQLQSVAEGLMRRRRWSDRLALDELVKGVFLGHLQPPEDYKQQDQEHGRDDAGEPVDAAKEQAGGDRQDQDDDEDGDRVH